jgi:hypothetical protein
MCTILSSFNCRHFPTLQQDTWVWSTGQLDIKKSAELQLLTMFLATLAIVIPYYSILISVILCTLVIYYHSRHLGKTGMQARWLA